MSNINFDNPYLLLIAVPLIVLFTVPFVLAVNKDNRNGHNIASQIMHVFLAIIIAFAAAGTSVTTVLTQTHVYVVADVSYSENKNLDTIDNIITEQLKLPRNSKVGIVTFGKDYELLCGLSDQKNLKSVKEYTVDDSETNIAEALEYAGSLFQPDVIKRVVLITDAKQTDDMDTSAMRRAVDYLESRKIKVDAYFVDGSLRDDKPEVQISGAEFTGTAFIDHEESVNITIQSNCETQALVHIYKDGVELTDRTWVGTLGVGNTNATIKLDTTESGTFDYELRVQTVPEENDSSQFNNSYKFTQTISGELKVLIVTNEWSDVKALVSRYSENATLDVYDNSSGSLLTKYNEVYSKYADNDKVNFYNFNRNVQPNNGYVTVKNVPYSIEELCVYDEIVLSNLDVRTILSPAKFVQSLDIAVSTFGKSLVTFGNTYIQGSESSVLKSLGNMLPVRIGQSDEDAKYYTIIIDSSRSMFMGSQTRRIDLAKDFSKKLLSTLNEGDRVSLISFWGDNEYIYGPTDFTSTDEIIEKIDEIKIKQGTILSGALSLAKQSMGGETADRFGDKQLMIITDGKDNGGDFEKSKELVSELYADGIVTSVIDLGRADDDANNNKPNTSNAVYQFLNGEDGIVKRGHGRYIYYNADTKNPPDDMTFGEMAGQIMETIVERETEVLVSRGTDEVIEDILNRYVTIPKVSGYFVASAKSSATSVLQVNHKKIDGSPKPLPLYAYWDYGNGRVSSFTSSWYYKNEKGQTSDWLAAWESKGGGSTDLNLHQAFLDKVLYVNIPSEKNDYPYTFGVVRDGSATQVLLTPHKETLHFDATATVKVILPDGEVISENLTFDKNLYYYNFRSSDTGRYQVEVVYSYLGFDYKAVSVFNVSYANEYDEFATFEASPLFRAINGRGQVVVEGELRLENEEHEMGTYTNDFTIPLLIIAVVLFVVDIVVRKLKWEDIVSFFGGFKKTQQGGKK